MALSVLEAIAIVLLAFIGLQILTTVCRLLYYHVIGPALHHNVDFTKFKGRWAVVTGSTDGLGKAYAEALARKGLNIVLISRSKTKLDAVATEIEAQYKIRTKVIEADFTGGKELYDHIEKELIGVDVAVLVNNVGMSYPHPEYFLSVPDNNKAFSDMISCNIISTTNMTLLVLPRMVEKKSGVVINISSATALMPSPFLTVYGSSKAYVKKLSEDLRLEYSSQGIVVQCVLPGVVATNMSKVKKTSWMAPSPQTFVEEALSRVGIQHSTTGYTAHSLMVLAIDTMKAICPAIAYYVIMKTMLNVRERAKRRYMS